MARSIDEIKQSMTRDFLSNKSVREKYDIAKNQTFEEAFSKVSLESIIFYVVASAIYVLECMMDYFRQDIERTLRNSANATLAWYYHKALEFQYGDELILDKTTYGYRYADVHKKARVVKYVTCKDKVGGIQINIAGEDSAGMPCKFSNDILTAFKQYINTIKPAGVFLSVQTTDPDDLLLDIDVQYDPLVLDKKGALISDNSIYPVEKALIRHIKNLTYGGKINKTKLIDVLQEAPGVIDIILKSVKVRAKGSDWEIKTSNNFSAYGGAFRINNIKQSINYVLQL